MATFGYLIALEAKYEPPAGWLEDVLRDEIRNHPGRLDIEAIEVTSMGEIETFPEPNMNSEEL